MGRFFCIICGNAHQMRIDAHLMRIGIWIRMPIPSTYRLWPRGLGTLQWGATGHEPTSCGDTGRSA